MFCNRKRNLQNGNKAKPRKKKGFVRRGNSHASLLLFVLMKYDDACIKRSTRF